jgi:hypothetical protein
LVDARKRGARRSKRGKPDIRRRTDPNFVVAYEGSTHVPAVIASGAGARLHVATLPALDPRLWSITDMHYICSADEIVHACMRAQSRAIGKEAQKVVCVNWWTGA